MTAPELAERWAVGAGVSSEAPALPSFPIMSQSWCELAFLHWFVPASQVMPLMPPGALPDVVPAGRFRGLTPVALVPFRMVGAGFGTRPAVPYFGTFWETNVRLYSVDAAGRHGVVFRSLDASRLAVVLGARLALGLPYRFSRMRGYERSLSGAREFGLDHRHPLAGTFRSAQSDSRACWRKARCRGRSRHLHHRSLGPAHRGPGPHTVRPQRAPTVVVAVGRGAAAR